jgi:hypothetical protein
VSIAFVAPSPSGAVFPTGGFAVLDEADFADALQRIGRSVR